MRVRLRKPQQVGQVPRGILAVGLVLLVAGPVGMVLTARPVPSAVAGGPSLDQVVRRAGCEWSEFDSDPRSNPPVSGRVDERVTAQDGSYVGRPAPSTLAATHALLHGRVIVQYRPSLAA